MANTYTLIEAKTLGSAVSSVTFSSIPQTYTDILLKISSRSSGTSLDLTVKLNGSSSNGSRKVLYGDGSSAASASDANSNWTFSVTSTYTSNTFSNCEIYIPNYTSSNYKSISSDTVIENNATTGYPILVAGLWSDNTAVSSIVLEQLSGNLEQYSTFYLYGIKNS